MVVGTNVGIGLEASVRFAHLGAKFLLVTCRDEKKCDQTQKIIMQRTGLTKQPSGDACSLASWPLAFETFENVSAFVSRFSTEAPNEGQLNALVVNAGVFGPEYDKTPDGWEISLQVNYLSMALLSILMLPYLIKSASLDSPSRLIVVSSISHHLGVKILEGAEKWTSVLQSMNAEKFCLDRERYYVTKLLEIMFIRELADRLQEPTPVIACTVHPGSSRSSLFRVYESTWYSRTLTQLGYMLLCARSCEEGSKTLVHAVMSDQNGEMHGKYLSNCQLTEEDDFLFTSEGKAFSHRLWTETVEVLAKVDKRVEGILKEHLRSP